MNAIDFQNGTVLITGDARGNGRATSERLLTLVARVSPWDVDAAALVAWLCSEGCSCTTTAVFNLSDECATH